MEESSNQGLSMITELLQQLSSDGLITAKQIADSLSLSSSQAYRKLNDSELTHSQFRTLFRHSSRAVQTRLLASIIGGTPWNAAFVEADLDVNGDGAVNTDDVLCATARACDSVAKVLTRQLHLHKNRMSRITPADAGPINQAITDAQTHLAAAGQIIDTLTAKPAIKPARRIA